MPHPKNRLKLTGDTHLPDVGYDYSMEDEEPAELAAPEEPRVYADGWQPPSPQQPVLDAQLQPQPQGMVQRMEQRASRLPARKPWLAVGMALTLGWMLARMLRRH